MTDHMEDCHYEHMKEYIHRCEDRHAEMQVTISRCHDGIDLLKSVVGQLSARVDHMQENMLHSIGEFSITLSPVVFKR